jgi:hypothetical protein
MKITVFHPAMEGLVDEDYRAFARRGHLKLDEILRLAESYGRVGSEYGYKQVKVEPDVEEGTFVISYSNKPIEEASPDEEETWDGHLKVFVHHDELQ